MAQKFKQRGTLWLKKYCAQSDDDYWYWVKTAHFVLHSKPNHIHKFRFKKYSLTDPDTLENTREVCIKVGDVGFVEYDNIKYFQYLGECNEDGSIITSGIDEDAFIDFLQTEAED